jgi:vacuolar-type H+-ATPase subunit H
VEDVLKRLLNAEQGAEARVEEADAARRKMIQDALDEARRLEEEFAKQVEARRKPFLATAEDGAHRRIAELEMESAALQRKLRDQAAANEQAAIRAALDLVLGEGR